MIYKIVDILDVEDSVRFFNEDDDEIVESLLGSMNHTMQTLNADVPNERLAMKVHYHSVKGNALQRITSFFPHIQQQVVVDGMLSKRASVTSGVPHGTVLGPLLPLQSVHLATRGHPQKLQQIVAPCAATRTHSFQLA
ncbi:Hypothetical predicted protein [Mytilus galloprovincialis]|uniref:Uncharacterized protein n=1 Tax=Mytilus galloprovincialis TaxID=29158 RepID=A0A8B6HRI5_MYTGA|nr:Hypothetical predicted protein [Mytilus galloprovincialis]